MQAFALVSQQAAEPTGLLIGLAGLTARSQCGGKCGMTVPSVMAAASGGCYMVIGMTAEDLPQAYPGTGEDGAELVPAPGGQTGRGRAMCNAYGAAPGLTAKGPALGWRINPRHALAAALFCWAGFLAVVVAVQTGRSEVLDTLGLQFWRTGPRLVLRGPTWALEAVRDITAIGGVLLRHLFAIGALAALLFLKLRREAAIFVGTVLGGWLLTRVIKDAVGRERPSIVPHLTDAGGYSFPSGHSFNSAVVFIAMALAFAAMSPRRDIRWTMIGSAVVLTWIIAASRVLLGVHFPSDVIAGWLGGAGWAFLAAALLDRPAAAATQ